MERDKSIDIIRFLALTGIILVHLGPDPLLRQLRTFDVPVMVFLSGVSYRLSGGCRGKYMSYVYKRFQRLILPTWLFLFFYELVYYGSQCALGTFLQIDWNNIFSVFTLQTRWYVWIIRVFFVVALFAPLIELLFKKWGAKFIMCFSVISILLIELTYNISNNDYYQFFAITWPYIFIFGIGYWATTIERNKSLTISLFFFVSWIIYTLIIYHYKKSIPLSEIQKYPPRYLYISYALGCSFLFWSIRKELLRITQIIKIDRILLFIGSHTLWIYLWHILFLLVDQKFLVVNGVNFWLRFLIVYLLSIAITWCQVKIVERISVEYLTKEKSIVISRIFIG